MILDCSCGKAYRVRDDASPVPTRCPACGGTLRRQGESAAQQPIAELRAAAGKADRLERELVEAQSKAEKLAGEKDRELAEVRDQLSRSEAERRKVEARAAALDEGHGRAMEGKDRTIQALDASITSYRSKVDELQKRVDALENQRLNDLSHFDASLRHKEQNDRQQLDKTTQSHQKSLQDLRGELEARIADKERQVSEGRQALDREAAERRRLQETLDRLQGAADRAVAEKDATIAALTATQESYKSKLETIQRRLESLEELRRADQDASARRVRDGQALRARLEEAGHLAADLEHGADSIESALASMRDRARRLKSAVQESLAGTREEAPRLETPLPPVPEEIPSAEVAMDPKPGTRRWKSPPPELIAPVPDEGRVEEPSGVFHVVREEPSEDPEPAPATRADVEIPQEELPAVEPEAPAPPLAPASAAAQVVEDLPLISPAIEEDRSAATAPAAPPAAAKAESPTKRRFSWQRK